MIYEKVTELLTWLSQRFTCMQAFGKYFPRIKGFSFHEGNY